MPRSSTKLHFGCGPVYFSEWNNIDLDSESADMLLNLTDPLPFHDASITHMFNEHFIEHITRAEAVSFLKECNRILTPDGVIRITTPNLRFLVWSYLVGDKSEWGDLWQPDTICNMLNEGMRSWGHQFVYDSPELANILYEAGFTSVVFQKYHLSTDPELCGLESRPFHNELIVEARKSGASESTVDFSCTDENERQWSGADSLFDSVRRSVKTFALAQQQSATIVQQSAEIQQLKSEFAARLEGIAALTAELSNQEQLSSEYLQNIDTLTLRLHALEDEFTARETYLEALELLYHKAEAELAGFHKSWYGKLRSVINKSQQ